MYELPMIKKEASGANKKNLLFAFLFLLAILTWVGLIFFGHSQYTDEKTHTRQISRFIKGNYDVLPNLTTVPGYHYVIYAATAIFKDHSTQQFRMASLLISLLSIWIFYMIVKKVGSEIPRGKTLQYIFLPITFYYFPLVYTDIFSLLLVLLSFYFLLSRRFFLAALFILSSLLVRQNNIIWAMFFWLYAYIAENDWKFSWKIITDYFRKTRAFIVVFFSFFVFIIINKGVAIGDQEQHQLGFYMGNIYFFLVLCSLVFLPFLIDRLRNFKNIHCGRFYIGISLGIILSLAFIFFPPELHPYNLKMRFLRNIILNFAYNGYSLLYAMAILIGTVVLSVMKIDKKALIILPFIVLCLSQSFLIEQRYSIVPIVLILLFKQDQHKKIELFTIFYYLILSFGLVALLLKAGIFF